MKYQSAWPLQSKMNQMPKARRSMDGRRMTGPEPWMASTDDAMEADPRCGGLVVNESAQANSPNGSPISKRATVYIQSRGRPRRPSPSLHEGQIDWILRALLLELWHY
jgi:hypothetical protein